MVCRNMRRDRLAFWWRNDAPSNLPLKGGRCHEVTEGGKVLSSAKPGSKRPDAASFGKAEISHNGVDQGLRSLAGSRNNPQSRHNGFNACVSIHRPFHPHFLIPCHTAGTPAAGCGANVAWQAGGMPFRRGRNVRQGLGGDGGPSAVRWQRCAFPGPPPSQPPENFRVPVPVRRRQPDPGRKRACGGRVLRMRGGRSTPGRSRIVNARQPSVPERGSEAMPGCPCPGSPAGPVRRLSDADTIRRNSGRARGRATVLLHFLRQTPRAALRT